MHDFVAMINRIKLQWSMTDLVHGADRHVASHILSDTLSDTHTRTHTHAHAHTHTLPCSARMEGMRHSGIPMPMSSWHAGMLTPVIPSVTGCSTCKQVKEGHSS